MIPAGAEAMSFVDVINEVKNLTRILSPQKDGGSSNSPEMEPLKVIGAGMGRTGTSSLAKALRRLGYKTYHMEELALNHHAPTWAEYARSVLDGKSQSYIEAKKRAAIDIMARAGYNATTDFPACLLFEELMGEYPDAKVILSVRSSGKVWAESAQNTIGRAWPAMSRRPWAWVPPFRPWQDIMPFIWTSIGALPADPPPAASDPLNVYVLADIHDQWSQRVRSAVPAERLLVHSSSDGYGPLCTFLGVPDDDCPKEKYPRTNEAAEMKRTFDAMELMSSCFDVLMLVVAALISTKLILRYRRPRDQEEKVREGKIE